MKTFASVMFAAVALSSFVGCSMEASSEVTGEENEAFITCSNQEGTNAAVAALAVSIGQELHRWQLTTDFEEFRGFQNQLMLRLTPAGLAACGGSCPNTATLLTYQDSRNDQRFTFGGVKLSSWAFASRLTAGFDNQVSCQRNNQCPFVAHVLGAPVVSSPATACGNVFTFTAQKPASQGGGALTTTQVSGLKNALKWTDANGSNPWVAFQSTATTVSIDP